MEFKDLPKEFEALKFSLGSDSPDRKWLEICQALANELIAKDEEIDSLRATVNATREELESLEVSQTRKGDNLDNRIDDLGSDLSRLETRVSVMDRRI